MKYKRVFRRNIYCSTVLKKLIIFFDNLIKKNYPFFLSIFVFVLLFVFALIFNKYKSNKEINNFNKLQTIFNQKNYNLYSIRNNKSKVPRLFIKYFPKDFDAIQNKYIRKNIFIQIVLPLILKVNEEIINERNIVIKIKHKKQKNITLQTAELEFLKKISQKYKVSNDLNELMNRVDIIPVSLALAQAIQETGWGKSYFLINGNALFAEWTWKYDGMIPRERDSKLHHRIKTFPTLIESVRSYANILNSSKYYKHFRTTRKSLYRQGISYNGINLGDTMKHYSTTQDYLFFVKKIIIENSLTDFDKSELQKPL